MSLEGSTFYVLGDEGGRRSEMIRRSAAMARVDLACIESSEEYAACREEILKGRVLLIGSEWDFFFLLETEFPNIYMLHGKGHGPPKFPIQGELEIWNPYSDEVLLSKALRVWSTE